ncbi:MAG TPA: ATPase, T2SS/T4P/T4SS family [Chthoniobacteraceae bacterium]|jgi:type IV pilus assembly protein PilB|nr:type secretion system protein [Chthoniobacter sp.]HEV7867634.1 ATPase, T2SS/T4P/T4SS family [Chthoniobacteraceae bacterium]
MNAKQVLDLFVEQGLIDDAQKDDLATAVADTGKSLPQVMVDYEVCTEEEFYQHVATALGTDYVDLAGFEPPTDVLRLITAGHAILHKAFPLGLEGNTIQLTMGDPFNMQTLEDLRFALGKEIQCVVAPVWQIEELIKKHYGTDAGSMDEILSQLGGGLEFGGPDGGIDLKNLEAEANATPIIRYVDLIVYQAINDRASDIHFEPFETEFKIRYRVDGALYEMSPPPRHLALPVISRVKVMANLNIAERRLPQDGRIQMNLGGRQVDLRVSTLPTQFGESVVLRVLDRSAVKLELETLGMPGYIYNYLLHTIEKPNGIFIVTGPTGSGKTTTLYACLNKINTVDSKVLTAEDPVEYDIEGIIQVPMNDAIGLNFARTLRAFLRQDPDRIMVGETRDIETAQIAIQASLTGHLVFTTLHTNDAPGAVTRLVDMGVEPFMISSSLEGVLGQRLIRKICLNCRTAYEPTEAALAQLGLSPHEIGDKNFYYGKGCDTCNNTGYKGRKGIYELLDMSDPVRELINQRAPSVVLKQKAIELGMTTLRHDGLRSIYDGETSIEEVLKYT